VASTTDLTSDVQVEALPGLEIHAPDIASPHACVQIQLALVEEQGVPGVLEEAVDLHLTALGGDLFQDTNCQEELASVVFASGSSTFDFSLRVTSAPTVHLEVSFPDNPEVTLQILVAEQSYAEDERPEQSLVVYNQNAQGAAEIASHYATVRGIDEANLCPVRLPRGLYARPVELLGARRTVVEDCICPLIPEDQRPVPCVVSELSAVSTHSPINHVALIRGIPARLTGTIWPTDHWDPSFDFYLSLLLAMDLEVFEQSNGGVQSLSYPILNSVKGVTPPLDPSSHGFIANGRIEAMDVSRTLALIDRTMAAEGSGFQGNILTERELDPDHLDETPGRYFTSSFGPDCTDYLSLEPFVFEAPESSWNPALCRWGSTGSTATGSHNGMMPGWTDTTVSYPENVSLFLGTEPRANQQPTNGQVGFNNHANMLRWRKGGEPCEPLCENLSDDAEVLECIGDSIDFFKQINSQCVGVNSGFMGQQVRSYPVQYYGFFPSAWSVNGSGDADKTPPVLMESGGVEEDGAYVHFGQASHEALNQDVCVDENQQSIDCREHLAVNLQKTQTLQESLLVGEGRPLRIRFWYRNQGVTGTFLDLRLCLNQCDNEGTVDLRDAEGVLPALDLSDDHLEWTEAVFTVIATPEQAATIDAFKLWFDGRLHKLIRGFVDLDVVSVEDVTTGALLSSSSGWSFERVNRSSNTAGGFASDAIDRMGGIAVWGSSSHHLTGGWAWEELWNVAGALFQGRTLGESLVMDSAKSGIIYGDPLYRPFGVQIRNPQGENMVPPFSKLVISPEQASTQDLTISVLHGTDYIDTVSWSLSRCAYEDPAHCNEGDWAEMFTGVGAVREHAMPIVELGMIEENTGWTLRLRAWQPDDPQNHISAYGRYEIFSP
jgi:hypothetical protein